jgi:WD40 repeat protein
MQHLGSSGARIYALTISEDDRWIVAGTDRGEVHLWSSDGAKHTIIRTRECWLHGVAFGPEAQSVVTGGFDGSVRIWDMDGVEKVHFRAHHHGVSAIAVSARGDLVATTSVDGAIALWKLDGELVARLPQNTDGWRRLVAALDGKSFSVTDQSRTIRVYEEAEGARMPVDRSNFGADAISISVSGELVATGGAYGTIRVWKSDGTLLAMLNAHDSRVADVAFSPDCTWLVSIGADKKICLHALEEMRTVAALRVSAPLKSLVWHPDSTRIFAAGEGGIHHLRIHIPPGATSSAGG